ncbi:MAG: amino acid dehydrogenase [Gammaproteobacteria bacterium]
MQPTTNPFDGAHDLFHYAEALEYGEIHIKVDKATGLRAIIAIHSTKNGPALGGCRCIEYTNNYSGIKDALRLGQAMSYKAAILGLPHGGGKSVLLKPKSINDRRAYFHTFGKFVDSLGGRYIAAVDSGTSIQDMDYIVEQTRYVASHSGLNGDPSPATAVGVFRGIQAAVKFKLGKDNLDNLHIAIQGVGNVGYELAKLLHQAGARLSVTDISADAVKRCVDEFNATAIPADKIYEIECDIYAPCALGATLNDQTIPQLKATIVAGSANNQLGQLVHGEQLHNRGILYAPDYVINAGGLVYAATRYAHGANTNPAEIEHKINNIYDTLMNIFNRAHNEHQPTSTIVDIMAAERL